MSLLNIIIIIILASYTFELFLDFLNYRNWSPDVPKELKNFIDSAKYKRSQEYNKTSQRFEFIESAFGLIIILFALIFGVFGLIDSYITSNITENSTLVTLLFFAACYLINDILMLPFAIYSTFVIEEKFGFNKTTPKTFILDKLKGYLLTFVIGGIVLYLIKLFHDYSGQLFWLYAWIAITVISVFFSAFYTNLIIPIFNKLKPLEEGELRTQIEAYASKVKFPLDKILIMDASKRSSKGNAFFNGLFGKKNIVLYDTLIEKHSTEELVAVLAHEVGHFQKKHVLQMTIMGVFQTGIMLFLLGLFINNPAFSQVLGSNEVKFHLGLIAFTLIYSPISTILGIGFNIVSRTYEFQADRYAKDTFSGKALSNALKKLSVDNLSNLKPHPAYVFVNYSHPPVLERIKRL
jgi:STE24 endopeptidase